MKYQQTKLLCAFAALALAMSALPSQARDIKIGHSQSDGIPMHKALVSFAEEVKQKTNGELTFTILHGGVLGGDLEMAQQLRGGMLEAWSMSGLGNIEPMVPAAVVDELPYIFKDTQAVYDAFDGEFGKRLASQYIEPLGMKVICYLEFGFRHTVNNIRPITKPDDLKGIKLRVPQQEMRVEYFKLLGANPVPIAWPEVFTVLQQG
ncbi:MAG: TRAP transporter substrate-binding protein DctP, partial [Methylobacteriaceae bacterium]|nr:TRAP transporter substrate-binding protein DctP [Methylobacteriaceae bacterium]